MSVLDAGLKVQLFMELLLRKGRTWRPLSMADLEGHEELDLPWAGSLSHVAWEQIQTAKFETDETTGLIIDIMNNQEQVNDRYLSRTRENSTDPETRKVDTATEFDSRSHRRTRSRSLVACAPLAAHLGKREPPYFYIKSIETNRTSDTSVGETR
ncbi:hypothetical protein EVAR_57612_1 [Eumeta japonica]|uniref:Uncharacterized protein n=1 Tax=Eumeta variegata TaxID=151549 RepID=A0A4C1XXH6_EUMVA|nr:hypothetical protein EVAR_57612_1 [Eumeta japonica]